MTAATPIPAIQTAVHGLLSGDATLGGLVTGVFDNVPEGTAHPYVVMAFDSEIPDNHHGGFGRETLITLHTWTKARGYAEGSAITDRIMALLDHQPLTVAGFHHVATRFEFAQTLRDPDPTIRRHVTRFRIVTEQKE